MEIKVLRIRLRTGKSSMLVMKRLSRLLDWTVVQDIEEASDEEVDKEIERVQEANKCPLTVFSRGRDWKAER